MTATDLLRDVHKVFDGDRIDPQQVRIERTHTGHVYVTIDFACRSDLFTVCDWTGTKHPPPSERLRSALAGDGQLHYAATTPRGWLLRCVSFPHHPDRADQRAEAR